MAEFEGIMKLFAGISLLIGAVECFAGFKIMKTMMAIWGFFIGAMIGVCVGVIMESTLLGVVLVIMFGTALAVLAFRLYMAGIFILTAFLSGVAVYIMPENAFITALVAVGSGILAMFFVKPVVIVTTSVSGAGIILSSAYYLMNLGIKGSPVAMMILWVPIAITGIVVQYITTQKIKGERVSKKTKNEDLSASFSERKYPGMQRAYRNFCIQCGCELLGSTDRCPNCGKCYED